MDDFVSKEEILRTRTAIIEWLKVHHPDWLKKWTGDILDVRLNYARTTKFKEFVTVTFIKGRTSIDECYIPVEEFEQYPIKLHENQ